MDLIIKTEIFYILFRWGSGLLLFFTALSVQGQKEASHWFLAERNVLISTEEDITWKKDGAITSYGAIASMADSAGNLLFYCDGETVWDKNHRAMLNGTGLFGNTWGYQSVVIIPVREKIYYVFTIGMMKNNPLIRDSTLCYSVVDMAANNGQGMVTEKNVPVYHSVMDRMAAVKHANGIDTWVISISPGKFYPADPTEDVNFYAFLVTPCGVIDTIITATSYVSSLGTGALKFSPDGSKLALNLRDGMPGTYSPEYIFEFDNSTGIINLSSVKEICSSQTGLGFTRCFSQDSRYLYLWQGDFINGNNLLQFDLDAGDVCASRRSYPMYPSDHFMLGLDRSLYFINEWSGSAFVPIPPERHALMRLKDSNLPLEASNVEVLGNIRFRPYDYPTTYVTLPPNFIESYFDPNYKRPVDPDFNTTRVCAGVPTPLALNTNVFSTALHQIRWDFGDGTQSALLLPTQASDIVTHTYTTPGIYKVKAYLHYTCRTDSIVKEIIIDDFPHVNLGADTTVCEGTPYTFTLDQDFTSYLWQDANTSSSYTTTQAGTYAVTVNNTCGQATDEATLTAREFKAINLITPNGDALNDVFEVPGAVKGEGQLLIYDRWGSRVFYSDRYQQNWNAENLSEGIYYYEYSYQTCEPVKGWLQVVR